MSDCEGGPLDLPLRRVFCKSLPPGKVWYALNTDICGLKLSKFKSQTIFSLFPEELKTVNLRDLTDSAGRIPPLIWFGIRDRNQMNVHIGSLFGILAGTINQRGPKPNFINSRACLKAIDMINKLNCSCSPPTKEHENELDLHWKLVEAETSRKRLEKELAKMEMELKACRGRYNLVQEFETPIKSKIAPFLEESPPKSPESDSINLVFSTPHSRSVSSVFLNNIEEDQEISPPWKKRKVRQRAGNILSQVLNLCEAAGESLGEVIGHCLVATKDGRFKQGSSARETMEKALNTVAEKKGVEAIFNEVLPTDLWEKMIQSLRVPDWFLLLFKLQARVSDEAWQNLLNTSQVGRTGVSFSLKDHFTKIFCLSVIFTMSARSIFYSYHYIV